MKLSFFHFFRQRSITITMKQSIDSWRNWITPMIYGFNDTIKPTNTKPVTAAPKIIKIQPSIEPTVYPSAPITTPAQPTTTTTLQVMPPQKPQQPSMVYRKDWAFGVVYKEQEVVTYNGQCYISLQNNNISNYPGNDNKNWWSPLFNLETLTSIYGQQSSESDSCDNKTSNPQSFLVVYKDDFMKTFTFSCNYVLESNELPNFIQIIIPVNLIVNNISDRPPTKKTTKKTASAAGRRSAKLQQIVSEKFDVIILVDVNSNRIHCQCTNSNQYKVLDNSNFTEAVQIAELLNGTSALFLKHLQDSPIFEISWKKVNSLETETNCDVACLTIDTPRVVYN